MKRYDCLKILASMIAPEDIVVANVGNTSLELYSVRPSPANLYNINLGQCTPVALGLALALPNRRVLALDGDGNLLMNLASLADVAYHRSKNFRIIIFDNEAYESPGGLPSATARGADLAKMANASGIRKAVTVSNLEDFKKNLRDLLDEKELGVLVAKIETGTIKVSGFSMDGKRNKYIFAAYIEETEKKPVLRLRSQSPLVE
jgi:sulfopyruvate decarboxylase subunit beta